MQIEPMNTHVQIDQKIVFTAKVLRSYSLCKEVKSFLYTNKRMIWVWLFML